ncbi:MAG: CHAD domain-containing protein [Verrucomicrobiota bacterium]
MEKPRLSRTHAVSARPPRAGPAKRSASRSPAAPRASFSCQIPPGADGSAASAHSCLAGALETRWHCYREQLRICREDFSEEGVHELRVAARRLIAQLVLLGCVMHSAGLEKARRILKRRMAALGELRDTHVQRAFVAAHVARFPDLALLDAWLERRERRLAGQAARQPGLFKARKLEKWLRALSSDLGAKSRGAPALRRLTSAAIKATDDAFARAIERRRAIDPADPRTIHQTRVSFKRFRYMVESLSPDLTGLSKRQLRALAYYQRRMGIIQDMEVLGTCVARFIRENPEAEAPLRPFAAHLRRRQTLAQRSFLKTADRLFGFWPPAQLMAPGPAASGNRT